MKSDRRILIAGGGLLGRLLAWRLSAGRHGEVTLLEKGSLDQPVAAAWTAAGMLAPLSELADCDACIYELGLDSLAIWPDWISELERDSGQTIDFKQRGSLLVAHPQDHHLLQQFESKVRFKGADNRAVQRVDRGGIQALEPDLAQNIESGLYLTEEAALHSRQVLKALLRVIRAKGVACLEDREVTRCEPGRVYLNGGETLEADCVIDTRGTGASRELSGLRGVRGEVMLVESAEVRFQRPVRLMHPRYQLYVVPRPDNQLLIGATEIESEDYSPVSLRSSLELSSALYALNPSLGEARILESHSNCRPAMADNQPLLQAEAGLLRVNGLYRHGFLIAPAMVNRALAALAGTDSALLAKATQGEIHHA